MEGVYYVIPSILPAATTTISSMYVAAALFLLAGGVMTPQHQ